MYTFMQKKNKFATKKRTRLNKISNEIIDVVLYN